MKSSLSDLRRALPEGGNIFFMFPGQGAQYFHMCKDFYDNIREFRNYINYARDVIGDILSFDMVRIVFDPMRSKQDSFDDIHVTQSTLLAFSVATAHYLKSNGVIPSALIGASLGEFSSCVFSESISLEKMLECFLKHQDVFSSVNGYGAMCSVIGDITSSDIIFIKELGFELSSDYMDGHRVFSGPQRTLPNLKKYLSDNNFYYDVIPTHIAFHSSHIDTKKEDFLAVHEEVLTKPLIYPLYSCATKKVIDHIDGNHFWSIIREPIYFKDAFLSSLRQGDSLYIDVGPSGSLYGFAKALIPSGGSSSSTYMHTPFVSRAIDPSVLS